MGVVNCVLIIFICVGFALIVFSFVKKENKNNLSQLESISDFVDKSVGEVDSAIEQLNKLSNSIFEEFEEKYQELLFLYNLIDEKKNELDKSNNAKLKSRGRNANFIYANPHFGEIKKLQTQGMSILDISKKLNMGQGEVKFIMELGKPR